MEHAKERAAEEGRAKFPKAVPRPHENFALQEQKYQQLPRYDPQEHSGRINRSISH